MRASVRTAGRVFALSLLTVIVVSRPLAQAIGKQPVPDRQARKELTADVNEIYEDEMKAAKTPKELTKLANKILQDALATTDDATGRYVLITMAGNLAARAGDASTALRAVREMDQHYDIDSLKVESKALLSIAGKLRGVDHAIDVLPHLITSIDKAVRQERFDTAKEIVRAARAAARKAHDTDLIKSLRKREIEIKALAKMRETVNEAMVVLEMSPADGEANSTVGRYQCFDMDKWEVGIPMLALGTDEHLKEAAISELASPTDPAKQVEVGDQWWELAQNADDPHQAAIERRAVHWYTTAAPHLTGLLKKKVDQRIEHARKAGEPARSKPRRYEYGLEFSGSQHVRSNLRYSGTSTMTLEAVVMPTSYTGRNQAVLGTYYYSGMGLMLAGRKQWGFLVKDSVGRWAYAPTNAQLNRTVHLAGVYTGKTLALFVNGKLQAVAPTGGAHKPSEQPIGVGAYLRSGGHAAEFFRGRIVAVRISNAVLYQRNFTPQVPFEPTKQTVLLYQFEEGKGNKVQDLSGRGNHGVIIGARWVKLNP